ncbi:MULTISPECIES: DUF2567 domain-containing protein [Mycolicibacterium]|uniref:DUF2567 domain-containing protein n=1 Tax=Mycolicibacterium austroafricanum TaxID=39687 RepID=A0ABT8HM22_MYCAO|nr:MULTISPECIES: DUF2567 domain-containing protein [Mycolicibacterium]MDN4521615.1 DUF2567 domain-containing protein [Mycolicibacterium austroafricanum]MDW5610333.1 DUF2567 domain-containing protein [Mycolicibacterium sp. D5.8-2]PQP43757.1 DUF2567 domain-containing protein [Mycolicibacterium austroafricanum]QRZ09352.1 DUF2567 domain-containing protein [Mycolicibacterium austroafricanum]QZT59516.1 DUF2567 domain-containing protein [Mycolicibacterium austroafricanum]
MTHPAPSPTVSRSRAAVTVVAGLAAAGAVVGALWAWLAPPIRGVIALTRSGDRVKAYLGADSDHWFTSAALMVGMLSVLAVVAAVWVWQWRAHRGPVMTAALAVGAVASAATATGVGALVAHLRYGGIDMAAAPVSEQQRVHYIVEAPSVYFGHSPVQIAVTLLYPAAVAAIVYLFAAVATPRDDLGAWPPVENPLGPTGRNETTAGVPPVVPTSPSR